MLNIALKPVREKRISETKPPEVPAPSLLVTCDLACTWTLDGAPKGSIAGGRFRRGVGLEPGFRVAADRLGG